MRVKIIWAVLILQGTSDDSLLVWVSRGRNYVCIHAMTSQMLTKTLLRIGINLSGWEICSPAVGCTKPSIRNKPYTVYIVLICLPGDVVLKKSLEIRAEQRLHFQWKCIVLMEKCYQFTTSFGKLFANGTNRRCQKEKLTHSEFNWHGLCIVRCDHSSAQLSQ